MDHEAKSRLLQIAATHHLDAVGTMRCPFSPILSKQLSTNGPVPFAPENIKERLDPEALLPGTRSIIVILFPYKYKEEKQANIALYARSKDYHRVLRKYLDAIISEMKISYPDTKFHPIVDTSPLADRFLAYQAGLGFFGKNHCLIHPKYGSYFTIGSILTDLSFPSDSPLTLSCGDCTRCMDVCPGRCLKENKFNPWTCKSYLTQKKEPLTEAEEKIIQKTPLIFGCDECQKYCPFNERAALSPIPEISEARIPYLSKEQLTSLSNRKFLKDYKEYAFAWRGKSILLRNIELLEKKKKEMPQQTKKHSL